jgi:aconitate hydratase
VNDEQRSRRVAVEAGNFAHVLAASGGDLAESPAGEPQNAAEMVTNRPDTPPAEDSDAASHLAVDTSLGHGSIVIAAITSCTNTSNPSVMLGAALVAKKAVEKGLSVNPVVKTSLAPGSRVVTDYLAETGLQTYLDQLGFNLVGYGCTTCIGNSGPLEPEIEEAIRAGNLVTASVLSGNRNFEARVHSSVKANFLMSPPLVVAYALAGRVDLDLDSEPLGTGRNGDPVYLRDVWPTQEEIQAEIAKGLKPEMFTSQYSDLVNANPQWAGIEGVTGGLYNFDEASTYIQLPPFFEDFSMDPGEIESFEGMRAMGIFGDSVTTDHISPAGAIPADGPGGKYLLSHGVEKKNFNSFGSRRGNDRIMTRGTFANVRIKNLMAEGKEGGFTKLMPEGKPMDIFDACEVYKKRGTPLIVFGGDDYGMGSSRDWAAKGTRLLGVKAVVAKSFERIHRSNLIGMGVLPLQFLNGEDAASLGLDGSEIFALEGIDEDLKPMAEATLVITRADGTRETTSLRVRIDTGIEVDYYRHGGILPYVLRQILAAAV